MNRLPRGAAAMLVPWLASCTPESVDAQRRVTPGASFPPVTCVVTTITDGDTFGCTDVGKVRLIGIDAPEMNQRPYGVQSRGALAAIIGVGDTVRLQFDRSRTDRYRRSLAYAWVNRTMVNEAMVAGGWAVAVSYSPDTLFQARLRAAQRAAQGAQAGLWRSGGFSCLPSDRRKRYC